MGFFYDPAREPFPPHLVAARLTLVMPGSITDLKRCR